MNPALVVLSALLMRAIPVVFGLVIARNNGSTDYADFVLAMALFNLVASVFQLGLVPQIIRSVPESQWGDFLNGAVVKVVVLYLPVAVLVLLVDSVLRENLSVAAFAVGAVFGQLAGAVAGALMSRAGEFRRLLCHSLVFFSLAVLPLGPAVLGGPQVRGWSWMAGAWVASLGVLWLVVVARSLRYAPLDGRRESGMWRRFLGDGLYSASFGMVMAFGFYLANRSAVHIDDVDARAAVALGFQLLAIVIFIPSALSSYLVPRLRSSVSHGVLRNVLLQSAAWYLALGVVTAMSFALARPVLEQIYAIRVDGAGWTAFVMILVAATLAAVNAIFNQIFVAARQFGRQLGLAVLWLVVLFVGLRGNAGSATGPGLALAIAYLVLFCVSSLVVWRRGSGLLGLGADGTQ